MGWQLDMKPMARDSKVSHEGPSWPEVLKAWRAAKGLTQREAAGFFEVTLRTYQRWEDGEVRPLFNTPQMVEEVLS